MSNNRIKLNSDSIELGSYVIKDMYFIGYYDFTKIYKVIHISKLYIDKLPEPSIINVYVIKNISTMIEETIINNIYHINIIYSIKNIFSYISCIYPLYKSICINNELKCIITKIGLTGSNHDPDVYAHIILLDKSKKTIILGFNDEFYKILNDKSSLVLISSIRTKKLNMYCLNIILNYYTTSDKLQSLWTIFSDIIYYNE